MGRSDEESAQDTEAKRGGGDGMGGKYLETYDGLSLLNQHCMAVTQILKLLGDQGAIPKRESMYFRLMVEEVRASSSQTIMERLDEHEVRATADVSKRRLTLEKRLFGA